MPHLHLWSGSSRCVHGTSLLLWFLLHGENCSLFSSWTSLVSYQGTSIFIKGQCVHSQFQEYQQNKVCFFWIHLHSEFILAIDRWTTGVGRSTDNSWFKGGERKGGEKEGGRASFWHFFYLLIPYNYSEYCIILVFIMQTRYSLHYTMLLSAEGGQV